MSGTKKNLGTTTGLMEAWRAAGQKRSGEDLEQKPTPSAGLGTAAGLLAEWRKHAPKPEAQKPQAQKSANKIDDQTND